MDNASCHRNQEVKDFIIKSKNDFVYILPYHHYMNSIEKFFNQLKYYMKRDEPMSYDLIKKSIEKNKKLHGSNKKNKYIFEIINFVFKNEGCLLDDFYNFINKEISKSTICRIEKNVTLELFVKIFIK